MSMVNILNPGSITSSALHYNIPFSFSLGYATIDYKK